jgi:hypothetical protein
MQHALLVRVLHRRRHFRHQLGRLSWRQRPRPSHFGEIRTSDQIHCEEMLPILFAYLMDRDNVRMVQLRRIGCLGPKTSDLHRRRQPGIAQQFHRDFTTQAHLTRAENHSHAAPGDFFEEFVIA